MQAETQQKGVNQMKIQIRADSVEISGYVNAVERSSRPLMSRIGQFIERICKGAFSSALKRNDDVYLLLNHDMNRVLGSTKMGNLELTEDNIGLHARAVVTDPDVIQSARNGDLVGWSFGFLDTPDGVEAGIDEDTHLPLRKVRDLDLREVSILDRTKTPAYEGTLIMARSDDDIQYLGEPMIGDVSISEETENIREEEQPQQAEPEANIDYSIYEGWIKEMKGEKE